MVISNEVCLFIYGDLFIFIFFFVAAEISVDKQNL